MGTNRKNSNLKPNKKNEQMEKIGAASTVSINPSESPKPERDYIGGYVEREGGDIESSAELNDSEIAPDVENNEVVKLSFVEKIGNLFAPVKRLKEEKIELENRVAELEEKEKRISSEKSSLTAKYQNYIAEKSEEVIRLDSRIANLEENLREERFKNNQLSDQNNSLKKEGYREVAKEMRCEHLLEKYVSLKDALSALNSVDSKKPERTLSEILTNPTPEERKSLYGYFLKILKDRFLIGNSATDLSKGLEEIKSKIEKASGSNADIENIRKERNKIQEDLEKANRELAALRKKDPVEETVAMINDGNLSDNLKNAFGGWLTGQINERIDEEERQLTNNSLDEVIVSLAEKISMPSDSDSAYEKGRNSRQQDIDERDSQIADLNNQLESFKSEVEKRDEFIENLNRIVSEKEKAISHEQKRVEELKETYKKGCEELRAELRKRHEGEVSALEANYKTQLKAKDLTHKQELKDLESKHSQELDELNANHEAETENLNKSHKDSLTKLKNDYEENILTIEATHEESMKSQKEHYEHELQIQKEDADNRYHTLKSESEKREEKMKAELNVADDRISGLYQDYQRAIGRLLVAIDEGVRESFTGTNRDNWVANSIDETVLANDMYGLEEFMEQLSESLDNEEQNRSAENLRNALREWFLKVLRINSATWIDCLARLDLYSRVPFIAENFIQSGVDIEKFGEAFTALRLLLAEVGVTLQTPRLFIERFDEKDYDAEPIKNITTGIKDVASHVQDEETIIDLFTVGYAVDGEQMRKPTVSRLNA